MRVGPRPPQVIPTKAVQGRTRAYAIDAKLFDWKPEAPDFYRNIHRLGEGSQQAAFLKWGEDPRVGKVPRELVSSERRAPGTPGYAPDARARAIAQARVTVFLMNVLRQSPEIREKFGKVIPEVACTRGGVLWMKYCGRDQFESVFDLPQPWIHQKDELAKLAQSVLDREFPELKGEVSIDDNFANFRYRGGRVDSWFDPLVFKGSGARVLELGRQLGNAQP